jgi:hypothetical protein
VANLTYIFNCGVNPITTMMVNVQPVALPAGGLPPWPAGMSAKPAALTPVTIGLKPYGSGMPSSAALVAGNSNSVGISSNKVNYDGWLDLTQFSLQSVDNMAMFISFGPSSAFGASALTGAASVALLVLTDMFGEFTRSYFIGGAVLHR